MSYRGLCDECGVTRAIANAVELHAHSGPYFDHWRRRTLAAFGVVEASARDDRA